MNFLFRNTFGLLLCGIVFFMSACVNKGKKVPIDAGINSHLYFKEGSYWVFKDSLSGQLDSIYVSSVIDEYRGPVDVNIDETEYQNVTISLGQYRNGVNEPFGFGVLKYAGNLITCSIFRDSAGFNGAPYNISSSYPGSPAFSAITVNGATYSNPVLYTFSQSTTGPAYFVDDIGPVKITLTYTNNPQVFVWELLRHHVVI